MSQSGNEANEKPVLSAHKAVGRPEKERLLNQKARVIWITGLSGAGKTTIAKHLDVLLYNHGFIAQILDGDIIRSGINSNLTFSDRDRYENIRRIAEVSRLFLQCGIITINCFISPTEKMRTMARRIIGAENFIEVFASAPIEVCEKRDPKGLYRKARRGEIPDFTGIGSPFEIPAYADIVIESGTQTEKESVQQLFEFILPFITHSGLN